jgi:hypothetical protein
MMVILIFTPFILIITDELLSVAITAISSGNGSLPISSAEINAFKIYMSSGTLVGNSYTAQIYNTLYNNCGIGTYTSFPAYLYTLNTNATDIATIASTFKLSRLSA